MVVGYRIQHGSVGLIPFLGGEMKPIISLFDKTLLALQPWHKAGHECWAFDMQHPAGVTKSPEGIWLVGMEFNPMAIHGDCRKVADLVGKEPGLIMSFADCTHLTTTGARWWAEKAKADPKFQEKAVTLARMAEYLAAEFYWGRGLNAIPWMLENPAVSKLNTMWRRPDHKFDPWHYGRYLPVDDVHPLYPEIYPARDAYCKNTGIWCGDGFIMPQRRMAGDFIRAGNPGWAKCGGKSLRTKNIRSCGPRGFLEAVYHANQKQAQ